MKGNFVVGNLNVKGDVRHFSPNLLIALECKQIYCREQIVKRNKILQRVDNHFGFFVLSYRCNESISHRIFCYSLRLTIYTLLYMK